MIPAAFNYTAVTTIPEAIKLLQANPEAKILAGGHSLIPLMKFRLATPPMLIDINSLSNLEYTREDGGFLKIGALTRDSALEEFPLIRTKYPILYETSRMIADPLVRNMATVGGNLAHADPANDHPATMIALRAQVVVTGPKGERTIPIDQFFTGLFSTALAHDEILTEIRVPVPPTHSGGAYFKVERKVGDFATAGVAAWVTLSGKGTVEQVGIGLTNVGPPGLRAKRSEDALRGKTPDDKLTGQAGQLAADDCSPGSDLRGSEEYKRNLVRVLTIRALNRALERAKGGK